MGKRVGVLILLLILAGIGVLLGSLHGGPETNPPSDQESPALPDGLGRVEVEVLNASGLSGIAREATGHLRDQGFDVVYYGNARTYGSDPSVVIDRVGNPAAARLVAEALGIPGIRY
ncbi:MAG: LytR C-terminal domain-containing protein, partial [Gemmatimonadota bacterium]